jgi:hypothetical protein
MKHLTEEELIASYYGEGSAEGDLANHLRTCRECSARLAELSDSLDAIRPVSAPQRSADYGDLVWQTLRPSLTPYQSPQRHRFLWRRWFHFRILVAAGLGAALIIVAFLGGRYWERHTAKTTQIAGAANQQATQRVVFVILTDHLDRTERLLVALEHADTADVVENSQLQSEARELLASNRLYRTTAANAGDPALAGVLDRLERVLAEVANESNLTPADLDRVRQEMNTEGILFEIRVLRSQAPNQTNTPARANGASI